MGDTTINGTGLSTPERAPLHVDRLLEGARLVIVGGTGFLGKVFLSLLLSRYPRVGRIYFVVRPRDDQGPEERFWSQIAPSEVFEPLREAHPGAEYERFLAERLTLVAGDLVRPLCGLDEDLVRELRGTIDAVINTAGVVDFSPPLDEALEVNAFGVENLIALARALGDVPVMHTSTCYVAGNKSGAVAEVDPREHPFPRADELERSHWDPRREIRECLDLVHQARQRCDDAFRQSHFLDRAKRNLMDRGEPCRGQPLADELARVRRKFIHDRLVEAGTERALFWGWPNIYTYTKSIGEQVLAGSGLRFTIVRPAVIESAVEFPFRGWNEGVNTSAPIIYMALHGMVQFPASHDVFLDIIPVDMVASGMILSLAELLAGDAHPVYQYGTSDTNACRMTRFLELIGLYKRRQVGSGKESYLLAWAKAQLEPRGVSAEHFEILGAGGLARAASAGAEALRKAPVARGLFAPAARALDALSARERKVAEILRMFVPFTLENDYRFSCAHTRAAFARLAPGEAQRLVWWPERLDWRFWMLDVHLPGLERWVLPKIDEKLRREVKPLRRYDTLLDLLEEMAERHDLSVALQRLEADGLSRTTFREWHERACATAARLASLGVRKGDRVVLSGLNHPDWPVAYFGILRAGATAVPVDPTLEGAALANVIRRSGARVALWDDEVAAKGGATARGLLDGEGPSVLSLDAATEADPSLRPPEVRLEPTDVASLIYTSGTTGDPKGVMLSHQNFTSLLASLAPIFPLTTGDRILSVLPLHHTFEFTCGMLLPLSRGSRVVYLDELSADRLSVGLLRGRITGMVGVPALWQMLERRIVSRVREQGEVAAALFDWGLELNRMLGRKLGVNAGRVLFGPVHEALGGNIRHMISGGAALPGETAKLFAGVGLPLSEGYGLTEAAPVLTVSKASPRARAGQVGRPLPGIEIKIANPDEHGVGEVLARGDNVMLGYADNPEATKAALDAEGWLHTGDLGKLDERSRLVIVGRHKEVIVASNGENVYPDDVEALLGKVAHVAELAIVGIDDGRGGERVACLAVAEPDETTPRALHKERALAALREAVARLPRAMQPAVLHLYEASLPRTATRKVKRTEVKQILSRLVGATTLTADPDVGDLSSTSAVRLAVAALTGRKAGELRGALSLRGDLGFDSLMSMELLVALEAQLGRALDPDRFSACDTIDEVEQLIGQGSRMSLPPSLAPARDGDVHGLADALRRAGDHLPSALRFAVDGDEPIRLPEVMQDAAKRVFGSVQMGFYEGVMRPRVTGRAYLPHNRNTIVVSNHASHLDMGLVKFALGSYGEGLVSLAAQDYFFSGNRWRRAYFENFTNLAPFDRKSGLRQALRQAGELLERGRTILLFPEGTRSPDGQIHEFKAAVGHLALTHGIDILPVYLGGTYEALPKGGKLPRRRELLARIGPPLAAADLARLTAGMKLAEASREVARLSRQAVLALRDGTVLDLARMDAREAGGPAPREENGLAALFRELETKFVRGSVAAPISYYVTLGDDSGAKWTVRVGPEGCVVRPGKPEGGQADCVLKTTPEIFTKIVREAYVPTMTEFLTGAVKSNDPSLLQTFQRVFDLS